MKHIPSLKHGSDMQKSSIEIALKLSTGNRGLKSHISPENRSVHSHRNRFKLRLSVCSTFMHVPPLRQGLLTSQIGSRFVHNSPLNPRPQLHSKSFTKSIHSPLFWHRLIKQSLIFSSHRSPWNPISQLQMYSLTPSIHSPLLQ